MDRLAAVLELYLKMDAETREVMRAMVETPANQAEPPEIDEVGRNLQTALALEILRAKGVKVVGDLVSLECDDLKMEGMILLIDRVSAAYDQVEGFVDLIIMEDCYRDPILSTIPPEADGTMLCEWLNKHYPDAPEDNPKPKQIAQRKRHRHTGPQ
jgi:hypothetical protein